MLSCIHIDKNMNVLGTSSILLIQNYISSDSYGYKPLLTEASWTTMLTYQWG